jgi:hypothetical protein
LLCWGSGRKCTNKLDIKRAQAMAAGAVRARADYDYLIKLLLIGDSGKKPWLVYVLRYPWFDDSLC